MKANQVYTALESISQGNARRVDGTTSQFLQERGLVTILDSTQYRKMQSDASRLDSISKDINSYQSQVGDYETQKETLTGKLNSGWHNFWSGQSTLNREQRELDDTESRLGKANQELSDSQAEKERLEGVKHDLEGYVRTSEGYVRTTDKASSMMPRIKSRLYRVAEESYDTLDEEITQIDGKIGSSVQRFSQVYEKLANEYSHDRNIVLAAQQLAKYEGDSDDLVSRFKQISTLLDKEGWTSYKQAPITAGLVGMAEYTPEEATRRVVAAHNALVGINYTDDYNTAGAALAIVKRKADENMSQVLKDIESTFAEMREKTGWEYSSNNAPIAARLMFIGDGAVQKVHDIYGALSDDEWSGSRETGILATILANAQGEPKDLVSRTKSVFDSLQERGWSRSSTYNIPAGVLAIMPGTPEELTETLQVAYNALDAKGFKSNTTHLAAGVLAESYVQLQNTDFFQRIASDASSFSAASSYSSDSGIGFNLGWAVAGDLIDNGSLDLSGGFIAGGLLGGLLD